MIAVWLYGYSRGVTSGRELERQMEYEPGLMWLTGMEVINHRTLSDFRIEHGEALTDLFAQMLVVLSDAGLVRMQLVAHDGTKIRAQAGADSFRREATIRESWKRRGNWWRRTRKSMVEGTSGSEQRNNELGGSGRSEPRQRWKN